MSSNRAAYFTGNGQPLKIDSAPVIQPGAHEILVQNKALAINPVDWVMQNLGTKAFPFLQFPCVGGYDISGTVTAIGSSIARFKKGDRVVGFARGGTPSHNERGAFQEYSIISENVASPIPDFVSFEKACVLPLGLSTSASGLFGKEYLALPLPSLDPKPTGKVLLVWAGSSSVGANAIQLGVAAGCEVITTCSPHNFELVERLGAKKAFDYRDPDVVEKIVKYLEGKELIGTLGNGNVTESGHSSSTASQILEIVSRSKGRNFIATAVIYNGPTPDGVEQKFIVGDSLADNEVGSAVYEHYLPQALEQKKFVPAPEPLVVGKGLEKIQEAFDIQRKGVSAKKVVVLL